MAELKGAEVFAVGTWNGLTFTQDDLDGIVSAFATLQQTGRVPLKFGHDDEQEITEGQPALGWVSRVWRDGNKLLADFSDVPKIVYDVIRKGLYKFVSIELLRGVELAGKSFANVLDAVALLGADIPAVSDLKSLQALTLSRAPGVRFSARAAFSRQEKLSTGGASRSMSDQNDDIERARKTAADEVRVKAEREKLDAEIALFKREQAAAAEREKTEKISKHRDSLKATFDRAVKEGRITSAQRDTGESLMKIANDDAVMGVSVDDVEKFTKAMEGNGRRQSPQQRSAFSRNDRNSSHDAEQPGNELAALLEQEQIKAADKGEEFGPEHVARFARANRALVRGWMDSIGGGN